MVNEQSVFELSRFVCITIAYKSLVHVLYRLIYLCYFSYLLIYLCLHTIDQGRLTHWSKSILISDSFTIHRREREKKKKK